MYESVKPLIKVLPDLCILCKEAAENISLLAQTSIDTHGKFTMALSGGKTPQMLYRYLGDDFKDRISWKNVHLFWGDERCVPPEHPDSNFSLAYKELISHVSIPMRNIFRIPAESNPIEEAIKVYEKDLRDFFQYRFEKTGFTFDLVLLGVGKDGHTASLFPNSPALEEKEKWVKVVQAPDYMSPRDRVTLTLPLLNTAKNIYFLVSGENKKTVVTEILQKPEIAKSKYPAACIQSNEHIKWFLDTTVYIEMPV